MRRTGFEPVFFQLVSVVILGVGWMAGTHVSACPGRKWEGDWFTTTATSLLALWAIGQDDRNKRRRGQFKYLFAKPQVHRVSDVGGEI